MKETIRENFPETDYQPDEKELKEIEKVLNDETWATLPKMDYEKNKKELADIEKVLEEELEREMAQRLSKADREWLMCYHQKQRLLTAGKESLAFWKGWD